MIRFSASGAFLAVLSLTAFSFLAWVSVWLFGRDVEVQGEFGAFLNDLASVKVLWFGFHSQGPILIRQLGAFGLYFGSIAGIIYTTVLGFQKKFQWELVNPKVREMITISFYVAVVAGIFLMIVNLF